MRRSTSFGSKGSATMEPSTINVYKESSSISVGVRLVDAKKFGGVRVVELLPGGLLDTANVKKGCIITAVNGESCTQGHEHASNLLKTAEGTMVLEVLPKPPSRFSSIFGRSKSTTDPEFADVPAPDGEEGEGEPFEGDDAADMTGRMPPVPQGAPLGFGEYTVVLQRNNSSSIGMRLVQRRYDELPCVADIDKAGPAAGRSISIGDILLTVNGVDARASHEELKAALSSTQSATLKLRKASAVSLTPTPAPKGTIGVVKQDGGWFNCCMQRTAETGSAA